MSNERHSGLFERWVVLTMFAQVISMSEMSPSGNIDDLRLLTY
jgi:hypothetical protein